MAHVTEPDFRILFESLPGLYLVLTPAYRIVAVSDAYLRATMTRREAILGRDLFEVFPDNPNDPDATGVRNLHASLQRAILTRKPDAMAVQKYDIRRPDFEGGEFEERYWSPVNCPVVTASGEVMYVIHRVEDVTEFIRLKQHGLEREKMTEELRIQAERNETEVYLRAQELAAANRQLRAANDELGRLCRQIGLLMAQAGNELRTESTSESNADHDLRVSPEDMLRRVSQLIAGRRSMEEELRQAHKMEAIGRLAGGVAHDFNNLLTVIAGYADLVRMDVEEGALAESIDEIKHAADRAAELTKQLLAFSRKQVLQPRLLDLNEIVGDIERMVRRLIGENIVLVTVLAGGLAKVKADRGQIEQVIVNLTVNARDAMPKGGRLIIETRCVGTPDAKLKSGEYVGLKVSDSGVGMDAETIAHIFEPFYTTKAVGKGTGLGLSTVYGIVEQTGGTLRVTSQPGQGTTFEIYLPVSRDQDEAGTDRPPRGSCSSRSASVLVVEDDGKLRKLICTVLEKAKYDVFEAANAEEGLVLATQLAKGIDLLVTDVIMPGMSGPELFDQLRHKRPELKVLFLSGYDRNLIGDRHTQSGVGFLPKPFPPPALLARVAEFLSPPAREKCS